MTSIGVWKHSGLRIFEEGDSGNRLEIYLQGAFQLKAYYLSVSVYLGGAKCRNEN